MSNIATWWSDFATALGLLITAIGAGWAAKAVFVSEEDAITIAASRWAPETHEQGMKIPTVINLLKASRAAKVGLWMICLGTGLQVIPILARLFV
ncbi:hypothetical protein QFZ34_002192 [Phyllobacterium ifriqiyense]|uniref:DUF1772 domain-containing protein n=1 Tax=Phyllobacterium ifriqiyense TaxID=314238 RepID=A0ABU0S8C8_9HYPH|nr:hypothetical protein [Phyllobacterium ifriqiyense]MDQ0997010.1 hypothetical protein [Phyllobacterium ifriqiyense]